MRRHSANDQNSISIPITLILVLLIFAETELFAQCTQDCTNNNTILGGFAGSSTTGPNNAFFGYLAGNKNTTGFDNTFFGRSAGEKNISGTFNAFFGNGAGMDNTASNNSFFGRHAGHRNTSGTSNAYFGASAGKSGTTGSNNAFFGYLAGNKNTTGFDNAFFGRSAGEKNTTGTFNAFFGNGAGRDNTASDNSFFGRHAGHLNTTGSGNSYFGRTSGRNNISGSDNTFMGRSAGFYNESGNANAFFGKFAGVNAQGSGNICLGAGSGPTFSKRDVDMRLYIDVDTFASLGNDEPLIYGEFDNDFVRINGTFEVTAGLSNPSSVALKQDFVSIDKMEILKKVASVSVQEWAYKRDPTVRHLGPTAEAFREVFGLGHDAQSISTIDADGVALLAIQALKEEVDKLKAAYEVMEENNAALKKKWSELANRLAALEKAKQQ